MHATIDLLPFFFAVAQAGSFTAAARAMGQTKSRVSRAVAELERELDTELFYRTTRAVALTTAGVALFERASPPFEALREALGDLPAERETPSGELRLTAPVDLHEVLSDVVARYVLRWPEVRVDLDLTNRVVDLVRERFDLAVRATSGRLADTSLVARRVAQFEGLLYASPAYLARRGAPRDVDDGAHDWVVFQPSPKTPSISRVVVPRIRVNDFVTVRHLLRGGAGVGWLPRFFADPLVDAGELVHVVPSWRANAGAFYCVYPSRKHVPVKVTAFRDLLLEHMRTR